MEISNPGFEEKVRKDCDFIERFDDFAAQKCLHFSTFP
jgi:hypothetical protein